jgi:hypothetical protein
MIVKTSPPKHRAVVISHPRYSPALFPTVRSALKIKKFQDIEDIKKNVTAELNAISL